MSKKPCPCGSDHNYGDCCQPIHSGEQQPESVEALMRARYSAFVLADDDYLMDSWHPLTSPEYLDLSDNPDWVQLQVISSEQDNEQGRVHFRAFYRDGRKLGCLEEHSEFRKVNGRWLYLRGDIQ
jgi:SEC-C motif-containing protein